MVSDFLLNLNIKEGVISWMLRRITRLFFATLRDSVTVLSSTGLSIQEERKPEIGGK
jgi:hypothetical protein